MSSGVSVDRVQDRRFVDCNNTRSEENKMLKINVFCNFYE